MRPRLVFFLLTSIFTPQFFYVYAAQTPEATEPPLYTQKDIVVTASRIPKRVVPLTQYPGNVTIITASDIQRSGCCTLPEVLQDIPGINILDSSGQGLGGGLGANVSFRGIGAGDKVSTLVMLNGIKINQAVDNSVIWQAIPLSQISRIEVLKGGNSSIVYGEGALSGAINIITKDPTAKPTFHIAETWGSFGENTNAISAGGTASPMGYNVHLEQDNWGGYRDNNESRIKKALLDLRYSLNDVTELNTFHIISEENTETPGGLSAAEEDADRTQTIEFGQYWNRYEQSSVGLSRILSDDVTVDFSLYQQTRVNDSELNFDLGGGFLYLSTVHIDQKKYGGLFNMNWDHFLWDSNAISWGTDISDQGVRYDFGGTPNFARRQDLGIFAKDTWHATSSWIIEPALRYNTVSYMLDDRGQTFHDTLDYSGYSPGISTKFNINDKHSLFASANHAFKIPGTFDIVSVNQLYGQNNTELKGERAHNYEWGYSGQWGDLWHITSSIYQIDIEDEIITNVNAKPFSRNDNFNTRRRGWESDIRYDVLPQWQIGVNQAFTRSHFRGGAFDQQVIPLNPHSTTTFSNLFKLNTSCSMIFDWYFVRDQNKLNDFWTSEKMDNYDVLNLTLRYDKKDFSAFLRFNNLLDKHYSTLQSRNAVDGTTRGENPMPTFGVTAGVSYTF